MPLPHLPADRGSWSSGSASEVRSLAIPSESACRGSFDGNTVAWAVVLTLLNRAINDPVYQRWIYRYKRPSSSVGNSPKLDKRHLLGSIYGFAEDKHIAPEPSAAMPGLVLT